MSEVEDCVIKLFGQTIPLSVLKLQRQRQQQETLANDQSACSAAADDDDDDHGRDPETSLREESFNKELQEEQRQQEDKEHSGKQIIDDEQDQDDGSSMVKEDLKDPITSSGNCDDPKCPSVYRTISPLKCPKEQSESSTSQEKTSNKPDEILPCPRCNSMDTKFCYYNNYNVNQPRHFCKKCERYWTAGGTMRNVPVGAGRRKNKSSPASQCREIMISEARVQANGSSGNHNPCFGNNGTVFTFGSDSPLCESVTSVLNLLDKSQNCVRNGFHRPEQGIIVSGADSGDDHYRGSSITATHSSEKGGNFALQDVRTKNYRGSAPQVPYFPAPPRPYPWHTPMPPPGFYPSRFPVSFYPETTYWGCAFPGNWNKPFLPPTLGKHSRDGSIITPANSEKEEPSRGSNSSERTVSVSKTWRIDDPSEAAKSCIWATLGIKNERKISGEGLFNGFQSKSDDRNYIAETSAVLPANPAALSRSLNFHERT